MLTFRLNGKPVETREGTTFLAAARKHDVDIPTLCYHPAISPGVNCRICLVEDASTGKLFTACNTPVKAGMSVLTDSRKVMDARKYIIEMIFARHPVDCVVCEAANSCKLRRYAAAWGVRGDEYPRSGGFIPIIDKNPIIHRDYSKCIRCGLCVRSCAELQGAGAVEFTGYDSGYIPSSSYGRPLEGSACELCGLCVSLCPVGALMEKPSMHTGVETARVKTVCPYCGCGCSLELRVAGGRLVGSRAEVPGAWNGLSLCAKGRFGLSFVNHPDRLVHPLRRSGEGFMEASWEESLQDIAASLRAILKENGPSAVGVLASAKITNEENYLIQKFARTVLGTNNVDHCARL